MMTKATAMEFERLSVAEQIRLVGELWDRIAASPERVPLSDAQRTELDRRLASEREAPPAGIPWESVKRRALGPG